jgi:DAK2 domain fusion protein YloV
MQQLTGADLKKMIITGARVLKNYREVINVLNTFPVPDGDTGTNMDLTMRTALAELEKVPEDSVSSVAGALAMGSLLGARGNSGVILSQLFRGFARSLEGKAVVGTREFAHALQEGVNTAYNAVMKPVEGTILTVAKDSARAAVNASSRGLGFIELMSEVVDQAAITLERTPDLLPVLKEAGVVDSGGKGLLHIYEGFLFELKGETVEVKEEVLPEKTEVIRPQEFFRTEDIEFAYCTELMVRGERLNPDAIRDLIAGLGDSVLAVGDEKIVKVHIHTNNPGQVLEKCLLHGSLHNLKIENMRDQHGEILFDGKETVTTVPAEVDGIAVISVSVGSGLTEIMKSLGVHKLIQGGQTMNPSTEDFLQAVKDLPQREIIILPNNKNIVLAAEQVRELVEKEIRVIRSRSIPQGIAAMLAFNPEAEIDENEEAMAEAVKKVKSGQVTYAICDSRINGKDIRENDIIAIFDEELAVAGSDVNQVVKDLVFKMAGEDDEIITLYYGEPVDADTAGLLRDELAAIYSDRDVELYEGGQPLYYYIISVE